MSQEIRNLEPKALWNKFADLNAVPRPSKKEDRVIQFMKDFGNSLGLETFEDEIRNVIIHSGQLHTFNGPNEFLQIRTKDSRDSAGNYHPIKFQGKELSDKNYAFYLRPNFLNTILNSAK